MTTPDPGPQKTATKVSATTTRWPWTTCDHWRGPTYASSSSTGLSARIRASNQCSTVPRDLQGKPRNTAKLTVGRQRRLNIIYTSAHFRGATKTTATKWLHQNNRDAATKRPRQNDHDKTIDWFGSAKALWFVVQIIHILSSALV